MEYPSVSPASFPLKRKCDDSEAVLELLHGVSISPHSKRLRQEFGSISHANGIVPNLGGIPVPEVDFCDQPLVEMMSALPEVEFSEQLLNPSQLPVNDERAIVLYKPVNPPLFPGGPSAGSQLMLNARLLQSGVLDACNVLRNRKEDDLLWLPSRKSGVRIVDLTEEDVDGNGQDPQLAVVPWDSSSPMNMLALQGGVPPSNREVEGMIGGDDENEGVEAMEEDNEVSMDLVNSQSSNSTSSSCYEPWQQYGAPPRPQYSSLMWSH